MLLLEAFAKQRNARTDRFGGNEDALERCQAHYADVAKTAWFSFGSFSEENA